MIVVQCQMGWAFCISLDVNRCCALLQRFQAYYVLFHPSIADVQELVGPGNHVDVIRLALRAFLVHKGVYGILNMKTLDKAVYDLKEGLAQVWLTFLRCTHAFLDILPIMM